MKKNNIKTVLFDIDGVLLNSNRKFSIAYSKEYGVTLEKMSGFFNTKFKDCLIKKADLKKELSKVMKSWNWNDTVEKLLDYWFNRELNFDKNLLGYIDNLDRKGVTCCVASNQEKYRGKFLTKKLSNLTTFKKYYYSYTIGYEKKDKKYFKYILNDLNIDPIETIFWDDKQKNVASAKSTNIKAFHYTDYDNFISIMNNRIT